VVSRSEFALENNAPSLALEACCREVRTKREASKNSKKLETVALSLYLSIRTPQYIHHILPDITALSLQQMHPS